VKPVGLVSLVVLGVLALACAGDPVEEPPATPGPTATAPVPAPQAGAAPLATIVPLLSGPELIEALRGGGYVIAFRHSITDLSQSDREPLTLRDCSNQRNLSAAGREQARAIGRELSRLAIPYGVVLSSPYCRTRETAGLAFGVYDLHAALEQQLSREMSATAALMNDLLKVVPPPGLNTILVTHSTNLTVVGLPVIGEGDSVVLQPDGAGWRAVSLVQADDWAALR
jgi:phosphohistidine phosphatase SixA